MMSKMERKLSMLLAAMTGGVLISGTATANLTFDINDVNLVNGSKGLYGTEAIDETSCPLPEGSAGIRVTNENELRAALASAAGNSLNDTIILASPDANSVGLTLSVDAGDNPGTFFVADTQLNNITLISEDPCQPSSFVIKGSATGPAFVFSNSVAGATVTFKGVTLEEGKQGVVVDSYSLKIENGIMRNFNLGDTQGGAAVDVVNGSLSILQSEFSGNSMTNHDNADVVTVTGTTAVLAVQKSLFSDNIGRAIGSLGSNTTIATSKFKNNRAGGSSGAGAVYTEKSVTITDSLFENNQAEVGSAGAVFSRRDVKVDGSVFKGNTAVNYGGAIVAELNVKVASSLFDSNMVTATGSDIGMGAAIASLASNSTFALDVENSLFINNSANHSAGSILECAVQCRVINSYFSGNKANQVVTAAYFFTEADKNILANNIFDLPSGDSAYVLAALGDVKVSVFNNAIKAANQDVFSVSPGSLFQGDNIFVDDFLLDASLTPLAGSPVIDAGKKYASLLPSTDYLGNSRPVGASIDIGPAEYGVSDTKPVIQTFELSVDSVPQVVGFIDVLVGFVIDDNSTLVDVLFDDGSGEFVSIMPSSTSSRSLIHKVAFSTPGSRTLRLQVIDSRDESDIRTLVVDIDDATTAQVLETVKTTCVDDPDTCALDLDQIKKTYQNQCKSDPESCEVDVASIQSKAQQECKDDPASCGILSKFDATQIPSAEGEWTLMGTSAAVAEGEMSGKFGSVDVVWAYRDGQWQAYSAKSDIAVQLTAAGVPVLQSLPAYSGFWVRK